MAVGFPTKANWAAGDVLTASAQDDLAGTVNLLSNASAASGSVLLSNVAGSSFSYTPLIAGAKNALINGAFDFWQRSTSTTSQSYSCADRWYFSISANTTTFARESTIVPAGSQYSLKLTQATAASIIEAKQAIETGTSTTYAGKTVTLSAQVSASASTSFYTSLYYSTSTDVGPAGSWTQITATSGGTASASTTTFVSLSGVYAIPSTAKSVMAVIGVTSLAVGVSAYISLVQLELGSIPTAFTRAGGTLQGELAACQRYFWRHTPSYGAYGQQAFGMAASTTSASFTMPFPVTMRTTPTAIGTTTASTYYINDVGSNTAATSFTYDSGTTTNYGKFSVAVASGLTAYRPYFLINNNNTTSYIQWDAEL